MTSLDHNIVHCVNVTMSSQYPVYRHHINIQLQSNTFPFQGINMASATPSLAGQIALVTGASRGCGRGIALQLGKAGATVYITGRSEGDLQLTCKEVILRGAADAFAIVMDHSNDEEVEALFERIKKEQDGRLDICVNNAYAGINSIVENSGRMFYEQPIDMWDQLNGVGLRGHYLCTVFASRMMTERKSGLIVNISSPGGLRYAFNVAYGIGKSACDRMASDCAIELKKDHVAMISLWPGMVATEIIKKTCNRMLSDMRARIPAANLYFRSPELKYVQDVANQPEKWHEDNLDAESVEFSGMAIAHLAADPKIMDKSGRTLMTHDLAYEYNFKDVNGEIRGDIRNLKKTLEMQGHPWLAMMVPKCVLIPRYLVHFASFKF